MNTSSDEPHSISLGAVDPLGVILSQLDGALCRPLAALRADLDRLAGGADEAGGRPAESRSQVAQMADLCGELISLSRSYLDYAGVVRDTSPLRLEPAVIGGLLEQATRPLANLARSRGIAWTSRVEGQDAVVWTETRSVVRAIGHLVRNAIESTPVGGSVRVIGCLEGTTWRVTVMDTGPGIPEELRDRVFRPFVRLPRDHEGCGSSGLGLAACRALIERNGGTVALEDADGGGTAASVTLPADARRERLATHAQD